MKRFQERQDLKAEAERRDSEARLPKDPYRKAREAGIEADLKRAEGERKVKERLKAERDQVARMYQGAQGLTGEQLQAAVEQRKTVREAISVHVTSALYNRMCESAPITKHFGDRLRVGNMHEITILNQLEARMVHGCLPEDHPKRKAIERKWMK